MFPGSGLIAVETQTKDKTESTTGVKAYLARDAVWTEFSKAERRRDPSQQSDDIKVLDTTPGEYITQQHTI